MALVNRNIKRKPVDQIPLVEERGRFVVEVHDDDEDDEFYSKTETFKNHGITLWASDAVLLVIEHLQYFAMLLALSVRWGWPASFIKATHFTFLVNFDAWEFWMVQSGLFNRSTADFVASKEMGFNYTSYLAAWAAVVCLIGGAFLFVYILWIKRRPLYLLLYIARLKRIFFIVVQLLALPFGIAVARVFHCRSDTTKTKLVMDVQNEVECYTGYHIGLVALISLMCIGIYIVYPLILIRIIREQVFATNQEKHEGYLQLKEAEYEQGLDILWYVGQFHLFSSHRRAWVYFNPRKLIFKFLLCVAFAASMQSMFWGTAAMTFLFALFVVAVVIRKAFRVTSFNLIFTLGYHCLAIDALIGNLLGVPPWENPSQFVIVSFLRHPTLSYILISINGAYISIMVLWVIYLISRDSGLVGNKPLWPKLSFENVNYVAEDTKRYMKAVLKGRHTLEKSLSTVPLFAPVHELSRQVQIINAYCRETEFLRDPTHDTLWDLLDELIEAHNALAPVSVFGKSGKQSVRKTAKEFLKLMPYFCKRLQQRDYDLILVSPVKRRILLKMYILGVFVNGRAEKYSAGKKVEAALKKHDDQNFSFYESYDDGDSYKDSTVDSPYLVDEHGSRPATSDTIDEDGSHSRSVANFLEEMETWAKDHPKQDLPAGRQHRHVGSAGSGRGSDFGYSDKLVPKSTVRQTPTLYSATGSHSSLSLPGQIADDIGDQAGPAPRIAFASSQNRPSTNGSLR